MRLSGSSRYIVQGHDLKRILLSLLLLTGTATAGVQLIDGSSNQVFTDISTLNNSLVASGNAVTVTLRGQTTANVQVTSNTTTLNFEGSVDSANWVAINGVTIATGAIVATTTTTGIWTVDVAGLGSFRVRQSAAGAATVSVVASQGEALSSLDNALPTGANTIGALTANQSVNVAQIGAAGVGTVAAGVQRVGIAGNSNAAVDAANNAAAPANVLVSGIQLRDTTTATAGTVGQVGSPAGSLDHVQYYRYGGPVTFQCFNEAITAQANCTAAASGAGLFYYLSTLVISNEAATLNTFDVVSSVNTGCTTPVALTHKIEGGTLATTSSPLVIHILFNPPIKTNAANAFLCVRPSAATAYGVTMTGYIAP